MEKHLSGFHEDPPSVFSSSILGNGSLLFNVFNYDLSMMKGKLNSESEISPLSEGLLNDDGEMMEEDVAPSNTIPPLPEEICFPPRTPLSDMSSISDSSSRLPNKNWGLNRPQKRIDRKIPDPEVSTLTSIFDSNIKDCFWGQNRSLLNTAQTLDFDNVTECAQSDRTIDEMDYSRIVGFHVQEPDFYSDEDDVEDVNSASYDNDRHSGKCIVPIEYASLGAPNVQCEKCEACMWKEERTNKNVRRGRPEFSLYCAKGEIQLPKEKPIPSYMWQIYNDSKKGPRFKEGIRLYNSLFAFTSTGGRVDHSINCGGAPYIYRLNGQNHHLFGSLIPDNGEDPKFCQLYIYDTENEVTNRMKWINVRDGQTVHAEIVEGLMKMLDEKNELVKEFRTQRDRFKDGEVTDLEITLKVSRAADGRENHVGPSDEIAGIMVGDLDDNCGFRDIVIHSYEDGLQRISDIHPKLMSLQYPLLFPHGDDGFHVHLSYGIAGKKSSRKRALISQKEYYSYKFQVRCNQGMTPHLGGRLFQQYMKKAFFGKCLGVMYVVEFQKRGLPHVHMLIWHFPKKYSPSTTFDESGFPLYKRRNNEACREYGLLDDDNEWNQVLEQCGTCGFAPQIRHLFVHIMVNCRVTNLRKLWNTHCAHMIDDILMMRRKISGNERLLLNDKQLEFYALAEINKLLRSIGKSLKQFAEMPQPPTNYLDSDANNLIIEETSYDTSEMETLHNDLIVNSITRSRLWKTVKLHQLIHNMRISKGKNEFEVKRMKAFAQWVLDIGDGKIDRALNGDAEEDIIIPSEFCNVGSVNSVDDMIESTFPDLIENYKDLKYLSERAILTPRNNTVFHVNGLIVEKIPGDSVSYFSVDSAEEFPGTTSDLNNSFPTEYLNSLNIPGLPSHELKLKEGVVVMLTRNLNQTLGLRNGTRMMVTRCLSQCVECEVISGTFVGTRHFIPRMELSPTETKLPFKLLRKQMPLQICYVMTINKSQGQSLENVGLFLPKPVFSHGQLYVAVSRVTSPEGLKFFIESEMGLPTNITQNVVYKEVFQNLPSN
ncbi:hypothetical protein POM88_019014 [Heracleum sosnowskyi]|uniref:ATP-dependent DNA helicase n=1 Tax=Heracleum sosnowskyi TaxID=360622 RepID=A0AAD8IU17_9APIA|nr:hypothetical protein POM88_019014 [Heracleum sosnowskyi]